MKKIILFVAVCMALLSSGVFAMSVEFHPEFNTYKPVGWSTYTGIPVDDSSAGFTLELLDNNISNGKSLYLNSPDGTNPYYWVYVALHDSTFNTTNEIVPAPHDISFYLTCGVSGGWYNFSNSTNNTWSVGYNVYKLAWDTETMIPYASPPFSPTGRDLYVLNRDCFVAVDGLAGTEYLKVSFWAQNPDKQAICGTDSAVEYLQSATTTLIDINMQIWQMLFQIFSIVIILGAIFGIPLLVFKLVKWMIDEVKGGKKKVI
jgi:hypothetical protein